MAKNKRTIWTPTEKQDEFLSCPAREVLFGGSVGCGKTDSLLISALSQTGNRRHRAIIFRRTYPQLRDMIGRSHELYLPLGGSFNKQDKQWTFKSGAIVEFGYLDAPEDRYNYQGRAFSFLGFDELALWPGDATDANLEPCNSSYVYLLSRLRTVEGSGLRLEVRSTCTPGGPGHGWVKQRFGIGDDGGPSERTDPKTGYRRVFVPGRIDDNPYLAGGEYARFLDTLPEADRKSLKEGRWDSYAGAVFSEFRYKLHTCEPFEVPPDLEMWRGCDDGYESPACVLWLLYDEIHDRIFVVNELYARHLTPEALATAVLSIDKLYRREPLDGVIDSASFADIGLGGQSGKGSRGHIMNRLGCNWRPAVKGEGSRLAGKHLIHSRLAPKSDGWPGLIIFRTCRNLIRELPQLVYSTTHREDVDSTCQDHGYDCLRYSLSRKRFMSYTGGDVITYSTGY
jgi:Terminase large subunit, T4likevirus-type, N-terminal